MKVGHWIVAFACWPAAPTYAQTGAAPAPTVAAAVGGEGSDISGGGLVVRIGERCTVVTALHVVDGQAAVRIESSGRENWTGDLRGRSESGDVATIVSDAPGKRCADMPAADAIARAVQGSEGKLLIATKGGEVVPVPVSVTRVGSDVVRVTSRSAVLPITQGMSGSPLLMNDVPVAILTGIANGEQGRPGLAIRLDQAARLLGPTILPLVEVTVIAGSAPLLQMLGDNIARADAATLARYKGGGVGAADLSQALRQPSDDSFVAARLFESIHADPRRVDALAALLDLGLPPDLVVPARDPGEGTRPVYDKSLFWHAVDAGATDAAVMLLKRGASPHGFRAPDRASPGNRMILPTSYVFEKISEPEERRRLYDAMIEAGLVLPIAPRRFKRGANGKDCLSTTNPCPSDSRGEWHDSYEAWAEKAEAPAFKEVLAIRGGAVLRNYRGNVSCLANQARKPAVPAGWEATLARFPSHFAFVEEPGNVGQPDFAIEGFIGVFKDRAWFLSRQSGHLGWADYGDDFGLVSASRDLSRMDVYSDGTCNNRSCLRAEPFETAFDKGVMVLTDGNDHRWTGTKACRRR